MKRYFPSIAALTMSLMAGVFVPTLQADEWNKKTIITFNQPIDIQGTILEPGSYVLKLPGLNDNRNIVRILDADESHIIATIVATVAHRLTPTADSRFEFYNAAPGETPALRTWFYPSDNFGFEFPNGREGHRQ